MKKQLLVLFLCVSALPLCARPNTIKTEPVSFPGNDISHPALTVTKQLDVVPVNGPAEMRVNTNDSIATPLVVNDTQVHERAQATLKTSTLLTTGEGIVTGDPTVVVGLDEGTKNSYAEFGNLTITDNLPADNTWRGLGLGTTTLRVRNDEVFSLFPNNGIVEGGAHVTKGCNEVGWKKYGTRVLLVCNPGESPEPEEPEDCRYGAEWDEGRISSCRWTPEMYCPHSGNITGSDAAFRSLIADSYTQLCHNVTYVNRLGPTVCSQTPSEDGEVCVANDARIDWPMCSGSNMPTTDIHNQMVIYVSRCKPNPSQIGN